MSQVVLNHFFSTDFINEHQKKNLSNEFLAIYILLNFYPYGYPNQLVIDSIF